MAGKEALRVIQSSFVGEDVVIPNNEIVRVGMFASEVVGSILDVHKVKDFSYTKYSPDSFYPLDADQPYWWSQWNGLAGINELSEQIYGESREVFQIEGIDIVICEILGIGSKVRVGGKEKHMQMLDFDFSLDEVGVGAIMDAELPPGVILKTDRSFHYYGLGLIDEAEWNAWIRRLIKLEKSEELFGDQYLELCLDRGYSALRIFGYEGTSKEQTPVVVARV